jgi:DNA-binding MarR family transcriptional regulator
MTSPVANYSGYLLQHLASLLARQTDQSLQERLGIGFSEYKILVTVEQSTRIQQRDIADSLGQTEASISRQMRLLLRKGLLISHIDPKDHRSHVIRLTQSGARLIEAAHQTFIDSNESLLKNLNEKQKQQLQELITLLDSNITS